MAKFTQKDVVFADGKATIEVEGVALTLQDITAMLSEGTASPDHLAGMVALGQAVKNEMQEDGKRAKQSEALADLLKLQEDTVKPILEIAETILSENLGSLPSEFRISFIAKRISVDIDIPEEVVSDEQHKAWSEKLNLKGLSFSLSDDGDYVPTIKQGTRGQSSPTLEEGQYSLSQENEKVGVSVDFTVNDKGRTFLLTDESEAESISHPNLLKKAQVEPSDGELVDGSYTSDRPFQWPAKVIQSLATKLS